MASKAKGRQCAALPFVFRGGKLRVLLVTSRETGRWVLPKGWTEKRLALHALAAKEAFEEAGVVGQVERRPIGRYRYLKRGPRDRVTPCSVRVFPLRVDRLLDDWPERRERQRRWFGLAEAAMAVEEGGLVTLLLGLALPDPGAASEDRDAAEDRVQDGPQQMHEGVAELQGHPEEPLHAVGAERVVYREGQGGEDDDHRDLAGRRPDQARAGLAAALPNRP